MSGYGQPGYGHPSPVPPYPPAPRRGMPWWGWALIAFGLLSVLSCVGVLGLVAYVGAKGPDTKVYSGNEVPARFVATARELGVLEPGEQVRFFYSDAISDIKEGFYLASDRKVVIYIESAATPATTVPYETIASAELESSDTWIEDGTMTLELTDGSIVTFPVSSEGGRDKKFHQAIVNAIKKPAPATSTTAVER